MRRRQDCKQKREDLYGVEEAWMAFGQGGHVLFSYVFIVKPEEEQDKSGSVIFHPAGLWRF